MAFGVDAVDDEVTAVPVLSALVSAILMTRDGEWVDTDDECVLPRESPGIDAHICDPDGNVANGIFYQTGKLTRDGRAIFRQGWVN